jgi:hypothetical protein
MFGIPGSFCTLVSSLADRREQTSAKNFPLTAAMTAMICHNSDNFLHSIMMGKDWLNNFDLKQYDRAWNGITQHCPTK